MARFYYVGGTFMKNALYVFIAILWGSIQAAETRGWFSGWTQPAPSEISRERAERNRAYERAHAISNKDTKGAWGWFPWYYPPSSVDIEYERKAAHERDYNRAYGMAPKLGTGLPPRRSNKDELTEAYRKNALQNYQYAIRKREMADAIARDAAFEVEKAENRTRVPRYFTTPEQAEQFKKEYGRANEDWKTKKQRLDALEMKERSKAREYEGYLPWYSKIKF